MSWIDSSIVVGMLIFIILIASFTKRYTRSVSDFLSANRCAGRYLLTVADGMAAIGIINVLATFESYYCVGFCWNWWGIFACISTTLIVVTGWVVYRFRETRAMTLAQFLEIRYSKRFRIFTGVTGWCAGIIYYGIFPIVAARLFVFFLALPHSFSVAGFKIATYVVVMCVLLSVAVYLTISGGQISIIVVDFIQGSFVNIVFMLLAIFMIFKFNWQDVFVGLRHAPENQSMINPFKMAGQADFGPLFYLEATFVWFYGFMIWQGGQGFNSSGKNPHEQRMAKVISVWRQMLLWTMVLVFTLVTFAIFHNPKFSSLAQEIQMTISKIPDAEVQNQLRVPITLRCILPIGLIGLVGTVFVALTVSTDSSNLHSWGSIFIQDVVMPLRKKPLSAKAHLRLLRLSIIGVAIFAFIFGNIFPLKDYLMMFLQLTVAIFVSGAGCAVIGGLYWKRGTTAGAWSGMITGVALTTIGIILQNIIWPYVLPSIKASYPETIWLVNLPVKFPLNGMEMSALCPLLASSVYIIVSLLDKKSDFNMDRMLHRGRYAVGNEHADAHVKQIRGWKVLLDFGGKEFTKKDRILCSFSIWWYLSFVVIFIVGTILALTVGISDDAWSRYWLLQTILGLLVGFVVTFWLLIGGFRDLTNLFKSLNADKRDESDDGRVLSDCNCGDDISETENRLADKCANMRE